MAKPLLLAVATLLLASPPALLAATSIDEAYATAGSDMERIVGTDYEKQLDAYFASQPLTKALDACPDDPVSMRVVLRFDDAGALQDVTTDDVAAAFCVSQAFASNAPPTPPVRPLTIPFRYERSH